MAEPNPTTSEPTPPSFSTTQVTPIPTTFVGPSSISTRRTTPFPSPLPSTRPPSQIGSTKFPYAVAMICLSWLLIALFYLIVRCRQKAKNQYIIPRVFVLCSPRTVQFHYELILRVGLPSADFNPEKHDIDITVFGQHKHEAVPMTRINTRTLLDEPLVTNLSIVAYRLAEMPILSHLDLRHSGSHKAYVYAYDFTVIDLNTNKEAYYPLNHYIGSLMRPVTLVDEGQNLNAFQYPIDDVPLPQWTPEDMTLFLFTVVNFIMLVTSLMPINCSYANDIVAVVLTSLGAACLVIFLDWLLYYFLRWNQQRREYFTDQPWNNSSHKCCCCSPLCGYIFGNCRDGFVRTVLSILTAFMGLAAIYLTWTLTDKRESLVWLLTNTNTCTLIIGFWNAVRQAELGEAIVLLGLRLRGIDTSVISVHMSEIVSDMQTSSASHSTEDNLSGISTGTSMAGPMRSFGPRSSVKSFGFNPKFSQGLGLHASSRASTHPRPFGSRPSSTRSSTSAAASQLDPKLRPGSSLGDNEGHQKQLKAIKDRQAYSMRKIAHQHLLNQATKTSSTSLDNQQQQQQTVTSSVHHNQPSTTSSHGHHHHHHPHQQSTSQSRVSDQQKSSSGGKSVSPTNKIGSKPSQ